MSNNSVGGWHLYDFTIDSPMTLEPKFQKDLLNDFAGSIINKYNFDGSHDLIHFQNVREFVREIIENDFAGQEIIPGMSYERAKLFLMDVGYCHDLMDKKYIPASDEDIVKTMIWKIFHNIGYEPEECSIAIDLMEKMSFSYRLKRVKEGKSQIEDSILSNALKILSDADQLDAYRVERCLEYQKLKHSHITDEEERTKKIRGWVKTILVRRVLRYKDEFMSTSTGKFLSVPRHFLVEKYVNDLLFDADIYEYG